MSGIDHCTFKLFKLFVHIHPYYGSDLIPLTSVFSIFRLFLSQAAAKDAAKTATRRLSMFQYSPQTNETWQAGRTLHGAPGSDAVGSAPVRPPVPQTIRNAPEAKTPQNSPDPFRVLPPSTSVPGYDRMKNAAIAAGIASNNATRRGSTVNLVTSKNQTTTLMHRRSSSLGRELTEAQQIYYNVSSDPQKQGN